MTMTATSKVIDIKIEAASLTQRAATATIGGLLGAFILIGVGFAGPELIHNAAHDARHANALPCH
ncbi:MAG: CbtB-domain containing protein [Rhodospirillales bacterium]|nr:CbtB-domain containing protein [Rhodospirillales bacterium]